MLDKTTIINFGFPDILKNLNPQICFDDSFAEENLVGVGCHCRTDSAKFFLYDSSNGQSIFTMHFCITEGSTSLFDRLKTSERRIHLQHIATTASFRKQGIASFYIRKLIGYCIDNDIHIITLDVCPSSEDTSNALNESELTKFYTRFSTNELELLIIKC